MLEGGHNLSTLLFLIDGFLSLEGSSGLGGLEGEEFVGLGVVSIGRHLGRGTNEVRFWSQLTLTFVTSLSRECLMRSFSPHSIDCLDFWNTLLFSNSLAKFLISFMAALKTLLALLDARSVSSFLLSKSVEDCLLKQLMMAFDLIIQCNVHGQAGKFQSGSLGVNHRTKS